MKNNKQRLLMSFCIVLLLMCMLPFGAAYADNWTDTFSGFMNLTMRALEIENKATGINVVDGARNLLDWFSKPLKIVSNAFVETPYTTPMDEIDEYLNRSKISIRPDAITIDGVPYTNIWLSTDAAEQFRLNSFDIITAWNIASKSNGTYVSGVGDLNGLPLFTIDGRHLRTQAIECLPFTGIYTLGDGLVHQLEVSGNTTTVTLQLYNQSYPAGTAGWSLFPAHYYYTIDAVYPTKCEWAREFYQAGPYKTDIYNFEYNVYDFDFDWVAENIPASQVLSTNTGLSVQVPTSYINNWIINYGDDYTNYQLDIDTEDNDIMVMLGDLLALLTEISIDPNLNLNLDVGFDVDINPTPPTPTPTPIPTLPPDPTPPAPSPTPSTSTDLISNTPWINLEAWLQNIRDILRAIYEYVRLIADYYLENIYAELYYIGQIIEDFPDYFSVIVSNTNLINNNFQSYASNTNLSLQSIIEILNGIWTETEDINADQFTLLNLILSTNTSIKEKLDNIGDSVNNKLNLIYGKVGDISVDVGNLFDDLVLDIEQAPIKLADKVLDILKVAFLPILTRLRDALGIWHYVTTWISNIASPFAYFINILSSAYPVFMSPIYACVAGTLCILVYKRFGR